MARKIMFRSNYPLYASVMENGVVIDTHFPIDKYDDTDTQLFYVVPEQVLLELLGEDALRG